jgi:hypothetical protein
MNDHGKVLGGNSILTGFLVLVFGLSILFTQINGKNADPHDFPGHSMDGIPAEVDQIGFEFEPWQSDFGRFRQGMELLNRVPPDHAAALACFEENIRNASLAADIDYSHAWAMICLARLERWDDALNHYQILAERFPGTVEGGASGAARIWEPRLSEVRGIVASSPDPAAVRCLAAMLALDAVPLASGASTD